MAGVERLEGVEEGPAGGVGEVDEDPALVERLRPSPGPSAVRPPRPRLRPSGEDVAPRRESVRCMSVTRRSAPSGRRRDVGGGVEGVAALDGQVDGEAVETPSLKLSR